VPVRLNRYLASAGVGSRRAVDELIRDARVTVNGAVAELGTSVGEDDEVCVDGRPVSAERQAWVLLHKPAGVVTTANDPQRRPTVLDLVGSPLRLFPVGRLDMDTTGALLLTNDGLLAHRLMHPSHEVDKVYVAEVEGRPDAAALARLRSGIELDDGPTAPAQVRELAPGRIELRIHEGRNRQVRRMCDAVGHPVLRLVRTRIGPLHDRRLQPGDWRPLSVGEVRRLYEAATPDDGNSPGAENPPG
jgi:23S rRNA pseudouridine2605 synthase